MNYSPSHYTYISYVYYITFLLYIIYTVTQRLGICSKANILHSLDQFSAGIVAILTNTYILY